MEDMTSEERFEKIENILETVIENQAKHDAAIRDLIAVNRAVVDSQKETVAQIGALASNVEELRGAVDDLRGAVGDLRDGVQETRKEFQEGQRELQEAQKATEDKLHALIETVDRIIREKN